jgi:hypothetical protein
MQLAIALIIKHKRSACTIEKQHHKTKIEIQNLAQKKNLTIIKNVRFLRREQDSNLQRFNPR